MMFHAAPKAGFQLIFSQELQQCLFIAVPSEGSPINKSTSLLFCPHPQFVTWKISATPVGGLSFLLEQVCNFLVA